MPTQRSDRALRGLVADLAQLHPEDLATILSRLSPDQRDAVRALLQEAAPGGIPSASLQATTPGVSDWLLVRAGLPTRGGAQGSSDEISGPASLAPSAAAAIRQLVAPSAQTPAPSRRKGIDVLSLGLDR